MVKYIMKPQGLIMTGTNQLEMRIHDLNDKITKISYRLGRAEMLLDKLKKEESKYDDRKVDS